MYTCVPSLECPSPPLPYSPPLAPVPLSVTEHWTELPVSYIKFPLAIYFTHGNIYASMLVPQSSYPEETITEKDTWTPTFTAALFKIVRTWKQPRCPSQMNDKEVVVHNGILLSYIKRNAFNSVLMRWLDLETILKREVRQKEKDKYCTFFHF